MRVKRLEIQGFKSFKDKTVLHFDDGVTGIIGPNGCGKSNIVDSFFWVMGEQSIKHMRADGQIDLIFNGSEKYAPLSMAEVTLVLATGAKPSEIPAGASVRDLPPHLRYEEIAITRRLFRDGQSEYMINGQACRLKDIHELFMDTGAGPKAYSIIEQGQISRIVASKPEDRRVLIEEAAGIIKFKARKKESLRKIEATRQNLLRINDIITEIERTLNSLERQAHKARQYKKYKEELQGKELLVGRKKLFGLKNKITDLWTQVQSLETTELESRTVLQTLEAQIESLKIQMLEVQKWVEDTQMAFQIIQKDVAQEDTKIQLHRRKIQELENSNLSLEEENEALTGSLEKLTTEKAALENEIKSYNEMFQNADAILKDHQGKLDEAKKTADDMGRVVEQEKRELMSTLNHQSEVSSQVYGLEARVDSLSVQVDSLAVKIADRELDCEVFLEKLTTSKTLFESSSQKSSLLKEQADALKEAIQNLEVQLKQLRFDEAQAREEKVKTESKLKTLQQLVDNHEGMRPDVKNILKSNEFNKDLKGIFADEVEAHPGYEYALESVLRDFLENFLVNDSKNAKQFLDTLKEKSLGRATFWAMDLLNSKVQAEIQSSSKEVLSVLPNAKQLKDVIRINHPNAESILKIFDSYYVVDTFDEALEAFQKASRHSINIISRAGDCIDLYGRISGGSTKSLEGGMLARKAELQKLSEQMESVKQRSSELAQKLSDIETSLQEKKQSFDVVSSEFREVDLVAKTAERDFISSDSQYTKAKSELEKQSQEKTQFETERAQLWEKLDSIRLELSGIEGTTKQREILIEEKVKEHQAAAQLASEVQAALIQLKVDFAAAQEKLRHAKLNEERVQQNLQQSRHRKEEVDRLMNRKLDEKDMLSQELTIFEADFKVMAMKAAELEAKLKEQKNEYEQVSRRLNEGFTEQQRLMKVIETSSSDLNRFKLDQEKCSLEYQMLYQNLFQRYGIEESAIAPSSDEEKQVFDSLTPEKEAEMQAEVDKLHDRIRRLGEVNIMAVEEYDEQKKRHDFLLSQRQDLLKSIEDLERAIVKINKTSEERFKIAFEEINAKFQRIFPVVFGGGWAKLTLTNPSDLNETGVEIIAEPPGKKVGSIQLMSGGEKALTAVALIFSIFLIKPSPFCVLDEVDAPLDDNNVGKFNSLLKEMSQRSQFIIITHNKRTMELNDKLYGVTMEEPGVSKMVSIQFH